MSWNVFYKTPPHRRFTVSDALSEERYPMRVFMTFATLALALIVSILPVSAAEYRKIKVAVLDFQQQGSFETAGVGRIAAEWLTTGLVETGRFEIIERRLLQQIVDEQKMGVSGLLDPSSASRIGRLLGVKTVVTGTIQHYENTFELNVRLINVETGAIVTADRIKAGSVSGLRNMVSRITARIVRHFPLQGYVVQRTADRVMIDLGRQSGVSPGLQFSAFLEGKPLRHPKTGEVLSIERIEKGTLKITEVREKTALATITTESCTGCIQEGQQVSSVFVEEAQRRDELQQQQDEERKRLEQEQDDQEKRDKENRKAEEERKKKEKEVAERSKRQSEQGQILSGLVSVMTFPSQKESLTSLAISPAGGIVAAGDNDGRIMAWDLKTRQQLFVLPAHKGEVTAVDISHDGRLLASAGKDKRVTVWNISKQQQVASLEIKDKPTDIEFSRSGQQLAISAGNKESWVWSMSSNRTRTVKSDDDVRAVALSPDGRLLATGGEDKLISLWEPGTGRLQRRLSGHNKDIRMLAFVAGGKRLVSVSDDKQGILWDTKNGTQLRILGGHDDQIVHLAVSRDGRKLVTGERRRGDGLIILWDPETGRELRRYRAEKRVDLMGMTPDGTLLVIGHDKDLSVYQLN
jgi:WD40 repeat protein